MDQQLVLVLDFGGQYKELIARTVRSCNLYSEIKPGSISAADIKKIDPIGIILTGGPDSVYLPNSPKCDPEIFNLRIPILGICYGMQLICHMLSGEVRSGDVGEYGRVEVKPVDKPSFIALMSHRDFVHKLPQGFTATASTQMCPIAGFENKSRKIYGIQYHPESAHTKGGRAIIKSFLYDVCGAVGNYKLKNYITSKINEIRARVGDKRILLGLSGGLDSSVCAALLSKAVPGQLTCVFVDHGFMRLNEGDEIEQAFADRNLSFIRVNAGSRFLAKLKGVTDPEEKRKIIGEEFVKVFEEESIKLGRIPFLAQGTIYPDIVESGGKHGATIKSHHNVGGLPEKLEFEGLLEPLSGLFKDEVRALGIKLGLPPTLVYRQPFPGPGLAIRLIGEVTQEKLITLRLADFIMRDEISKLKTKPQQYFAVMTDTYTVGVKGDSRTYNPVIALRAVKTTDFMTCEYTELPHKVLKKISARITSEISSASRVVYDITSKPPATVEWE